LIVVLAMDQPVNDGFKKNGNVLLGCPFGIDNF